MHRSLLKRVLLIMVFGSASLALLGQAAAVPSTSSTSTSVTAQDTSTRVFLPSVVNKPQALSIFGVEISRGTVAQVGDTPRASRTAWVRYNGIVWSDIEPTRGAPDFSKLAQVDAELRAISAQGAKPIVIVRGAPAWAQQVPGWSCSAVRADARADFARFMSQIVARYSAHPYNVAHWEIGNEIDVDPRLVERDSMFGCWGNQNDPYYGGGDYAETLKAIYPVIKAASPSAQVVLGGLLLDCDPGRDANGCRSANFLEGVLRNGGASALDIIAYHAYTFWTPQTGEHDWDQANGKWNHRGGPLVGKLAFIREVLTRYGVSKPIMMNEGGLLCSPYHPCTDAIRPAQANYAVRLYARSMANALKASMWYTLTGPGWYESGLLNNDQSPRPAFATYAFMSQRLGDAAYVGTISGAGYEGYAFRSAGSVYRVFWTNNGETVPLALPAGTRAVYNMYGEPIVYSGAVTFQPIFVQSDS